MAFARRYRRLAQVADAPNLEGADGLVTFHFEVDAFIQALVDGLVFEQRRVVV